MKIIMRLACVALCLNANASSQTGYASWYGAENKISSAGKPIQHKYPALAHKHLPLGTKVKIVNTKNKASVVAVVEDRGPYTKNRIADLNIAAAKAIDIIKDGVVKVELISIK